MKKWVFNCVKRKSSKVLMLLFVLLGAGVVPAWSAPVVTDAAGSFADGQVVTILGSGFGLSGPRIELFDDFSGGSSGSTVPLESPKVGGWTAYGSPNHPTHVTTAHSGTFGAQIYNNGSQSLLTKVFKSPVTEVFLSWWVRIPDGSVFPGATSPGVLPNVSSWKMTWLMDGPDGYMGNDDLCVPTYTSQNLLRFAGNDYTPDVRMDMTNWWSFSKWMRLSAWVKANEVDPKKSGTFYWQALTEGVLQVEGIDTSRAAFDSDGNAFPDVPQWTQVNIPGWIRPTTGARPVYDDIYIAAGPNAAARLEIGNNPVYSQNTNLSILTPVSWGDKQITATFRQGSFKKGETVYLFVFDSNNNRNSQGLPITIGGAGEPVAIAPQAPKNLIIVQ